MSIRKRRLIEINDKHEVVYKGVYSMFPIEKYNGGSSRHRLKILCNRCYDKQCMLVLEVQGLI
jgi:hypothetical protein